MHNFMGIDMGTSSVKTIVVDEKGKKVAEAQREYEITSLRPGFAEQNVEMLWEATRQTILEISQTKPNISKEIKGVGFSGQMHGLVALDKNGKPLRDAILWCDQRAKKQVDEVYQTVGKEIYHQTTLNDLSAGFLLSSLLWVKENEPEVYCKIENVMLPKDYIRYRMCGEMGTDLSDASATLAYDTRHNIWAKDILKKLEISVDWFPKCKEAAEFAGKVTNECAKVTGLLVGTPLVFGGGDSIIQQVGNGVINENSPWIANIGTSCSVNCVANTAKHDSLFRVTTFSHTTKELWMLMGANLSGGVALKWLKNNMLSMQSYDEMTAEAGKITHGSEGLLFLPYLSGARTPVNDTKARGMYIGLTLNHTRAHLIRSAMEGLVYTMKTTTEIFEEIGLTTDSVIASGGGARGSLFLQMEADILGHPVKVAVNNEQSCLGAAIVAAVGTGFYQNYQEACQNMVHYERKIYEPNIQVKSLYEENYGIYKDIYTANSDLFHRLSETSHKK